MGRAPLPRPAAPCRCDSIRAYCPELVAEPLSPKSTGAPRRSVPKSRAFLPMAQFEKRPVCEHAGIDDRFAGRAVWLPILILGPFVILLFCASPHSDDICFAATWRDVGLMEMVRGLYLTFQGRIFSFVAAIVPFWIHGTLGGDLLVDFRAFCAAALGATLALALWACNALLPTASRSIRLFSGLMLAAVLVAGSPAARGYDLLGHRHRILHDPLAVLPRRDDLALSSGRPKEAARPVRGGPARDRRDADRHRDRDQRAGAARHRGRGDFCSVGCWPMRRANRWPMH